MNFSLIRREPTLPFFRPFGEPMFREMEEMSDRFNRLLGTWGRPYPYEKEALKVAEWAPAVDIQETETEYLVKAELPEIEKKDVKVTVQDNVLTIEGERKQEKEEKGKKFHRIERSYGTFLRTFTVPEEVEPTKLTAEFKEGVLTVRLPKGEKPRYKAIDVKVVS
ncbi:MAG: Hsp20/alpha crystallin family protein [Thermoanaerobaculia bacterium]